MVGAYHPADDGRVMTEIEHLVAQGDGNKALHLRRVRQRAVVVLHA